MEYRFLAILQKLKRMNESKCLKSNAILPLLLIYYLVAACAPARSTVHDPGPATQLPQSAEAKENEIRPGDLDQSLSGELGDLSVSGSGVRDGNGGDVVHCQAPVANFANRKVLSLDLYEAYLRKLTWDFGQSEDFTQIALNLLEQFKTVDAARYQKYRSWVQNFQKEALISDNLYIPQLADEGAVSLPAGCIIEQLVYHRQTILDATQRYMIKKSLWDAMDASNKAAIVLHEILYREGLDFGHQNSRRIRLFVAYLAAGKIGGMDPTTYQYFLSEIIQFRKFELIHQEMIFLGASVSYHPNGHIAKGMLAKAISQKIGDLTYNLPAETFIYFHSDESLASVENRQGVRADWSLNGLPETAKFRRCDGDGIFEKYVFDEKGTLTQGQCLVGSPIKACLQEFPSSDTAVEAAYYSDSCLVESKATEFYANGMIKSHEPQSQSYLSLPKFLWHSSIKKWPPLVAVKIASTIEFYSNGRLKSFVPSEALAIETDKGQIIQIGAEQVVSLSEEGMLLP